MLSLFGFVVVGYRWGLLVGCEVCVVLFIVCWFRVSWVSCLCVVLRAWGVVCMELVVCCFFVCCVLCDVCYVLIDVCLFFGVWCLVSVVFLVVGSSRLRIVWCSLVCCYHLT